MKKPTCAEWLQCYRHYRLGGLSAAKIYLAELGHNHAHLLSSRPPVVYLWWGRDDSILHEMLECFELTVLYLFPWCFVKDDLPQIQSHVRLTLARFPRHKIIFLCNEEYSVDYLKSCGLDAEFIHQNAFINEHVFDAVPEIKRTHDALYSASLAPYKRHLLAEKVQSLIILSYSYQGNYANDYGALVRKQLSGAWWAKDSINDKSKFTTRQIVELYARASAGLCLSAVEGGMFVSVEYLLCGLGVVSTNSIGGRSEFWDERYVVICDDTPESVAEGVVEIKRRQLRPEDVRRWTLEKIALHRQRMKVLMGSLGADLVCPWEPGSHGITNFLDLRKLGKSLRCLQAKYVTTVI